MHANHFPVKCTGSISIQNVVCGMGAAGATHTDSKEIIYWTRFSPDGKYFASTYSNGIVRIFEDSKVTPHCLVRFKPYQSSRVSATAVAGGAEPDAVTSISWRPKLAPQSTSNNLYEFLTTDAAGLVCQWGWNPKENPDRMSMRIEEGNECLCSEYSPEGTYFLTGGSDRVIRMYDSNTGDLKEKLTTGVDHEGKSRAAHTNRIFSLRFINEHTLISAGWESAIQIWDLRIAKSIRQFAGTRVCSDALDVNSNTTQVIVACNRPHEQLVLFDYFSGREIPAPDLTKHFGEMQMQAVRCGQDQKTLWCVGTKPNEVVILDMTNGNVIAKISDIPHTIFSCHLDPKSPSTRIILGGGDDLLFFAELTQ